MIDMWVFKVLLLVLPNALMLVLVDAARVIPAAGCG